MELSKTTINYATKRGLIVEIDMDRLWICVAADASEPICIYNVSENGNGFFWNSAPKWLSQQTKEENARRTTASRHHQRKGFLLQPRLLGNG